MHAALECCALGTIREHFSEELLLDDRPGREAIPSRIVPEVPSTNWFF
jgi:hypothetical protein